jgi:thioredoxin reductase
MGSESPSPWDVIIVGAGPAGLSAALVLGRCRRRVLLCDSGTPRSWASKEMHSFITREGISPREFVELAHAELRRYKNVTFWRGEVAQATAGAGNEFIVDLDGRPTRSRKLLIATGVMDQLPPIADITDFFGISVFNCPYCDGWEFRGQPLAVYGKRRRGYEMARALTAWTHDILLCTDGAARFNTDEIEHLQRNGIRLKQERITALEGTDGKLSAVRFKDGTAVPRTALFFDTPVHGQSMLAQQLGCRFNRHGGVVCGQYAASSVPGVYVAGNIIKDVQLSVVAAADGARAAFGINRALTREDFEHKAGIAHIEHPPVPSSE